MGFLLERVKCILDAVQGRQLCAVCLAVHYGLDYGRSFQCWPSLHPNLLCLTSFTVETRNLSICFVNLTYSCGEPCFEVLAYKTIRRQLSLSKQTKTRKCQETKEFSPSLLSDASDALCDGQTQGNHVETMKQEPRKLKANLFMVGQSAGKSLKSQGHLCFAIVCSSSTYVNNNYLCDLRHCSRFLSLTSNTFLTGKCDALSPPT